MLVKANERRLMHPPGILFERHVLFRDSKIAITVGKQYEVHAISVFNGVVFLQMVADHGISEWLPSLLFDLESGEIPDDWKVNIFSPDLQLVLGPTFLSQSEKAYGDMVELIPESVEDFHRRLRQRKT